MLKYPETSGGAYPRSPTGRTLWCGPFAIALVTGLGYDASYTKVLDDARRAEMKSRTLFARARGTSVSRTGLPKTVKGLSEASLARVLKKLKVSSTITKVRKDDRITMLTFTRDHTVKGQTYIVVAGNHWMTIKDGILYHAHHKPCPIADAPKYRMARVSWWATVKPRPEALVE